MSWERLKTDYTDSSWLGLKKYVQVQNEDNTVSFRDVTQYSNRQNSFFGAKQANRINTAINRIMSALERGTNLYSEFSEFFSTQKANFSKAYMQNLDELKQYIASLKVKADETVEQAKKDYQTDLKAYQKLQNAVFENWFGMIKGKLSQDSAGNLQNSVDHLNAKIDGFVAKTVTFNSDGSITEIDTDNQKLTTVFLPTGEIEQRLYKNNLPQAKKTVKFTQNEIKEVITNGME